MRRRGPILLTIALTLASVGLFLVGGHLAANLLIASQQTRQLEELSTVALRRSETAVDYGVATLDELARSRKVTCEAAALQSVRLHVYQRGAVKDIRVVDGSGSVQCSAYSETLEFDKGWVTRDAMLPAADRSLRLFRVEQFFGTALGVLREIDSEHGLVAILGISGSLFDIMPEELRNSSDVILELTGGQRIVHSATDDVTAAPQDVLSLSADSQKYPFRTVIEVDRAALAGWNREIYWPVVAIAGALGLLFGLLLARLAIRARSPVDDLDRAILAREFKPYYQPIFDLKTGRIVGAEMLARWIRSDGTVVPPARFIELAEQSGRIEAITWQLLTATLAELGPLMKRDKHFKVSINIAPRHFVSVGFIAELRRVVAAAGIATRQIMLELTEREAFEDLEQAAAKVAELRGYGFRIGIDDVGIGHSGLSQIQRLRADTLKIDKFFIDCIVRDVSAGIVVEMLVRLAAEMEMGIVAEGIETEDQAKALVARGVALGQGFLVAPPLPLNAFLDMLELRDMPTLRSAASLQAAAAA